MMSHGNIHTGNVMQTEQHVLGSTYVYAYMHITINEIRNHQFERELRGYIESLGGM